jgi:hypothetical protein
LDARLTTLPCKKFIVAKFKEEESEWCNSQKLINLDEVSKVDYGLKMDVSPMMIPAFSRGTEENHEILQS